MTPIKPLTGPGSQPAEDGDDFAFIEMPKGMRTYSMPQALESEDAKAYAPALLKLLAVLDALNAKPAPGASIAIDLTDLDAANRAFIDQTLGEGEVSIIAGASIQAQESVMAGVWRVHEVSDDGALTGDVIEVGEFPQSVLKLAQEAGRAGLRPFEEAAPQGELMNAPALAAELADKLASFTPGAPAHVINLSLLPVSDGDLAYLERRLGLGAVSILSRGYGNCRIMSTGVKNAWWVRYFNSREALILNTIEVTRLPGAACAAGQDLEDSAERLAEILETFR
jgi:hydrogenase-1 operon protein HyaF